MGPIGAWMRRGAYVGVDPVLRFAQCDKRPDRARQVGMTCPVKEPCFERGARHEPHGVCGGVSEEQRRQMRSERRIALDGGNDFGGPLFEVLGHGTVDGYNRHSEAGEHVCDACRHANPQAAFRRKGAA